MRVNLQQRNLQGAGATGWDVLESAVLTVNSLFSQADTTDTEKVDAAKPIIDSLQTQLTETRQQTNTMLFVGGAVIVAGVLGALFISRRR
jgi:hypothetical protein